MLLLWAIIIVGAAGMIVGLVKDKAGASWGRPVAIAGIAVVLVGVILYAVRSMGGSKNTEGLLDREAAFQRAAGKKLGLYLAEKYPGAKVVILGDAKVGGAPPRVSPLVEGFKEAVGTKMTVVAEVNPDIPAEKAKGFMAEMPQEGPAPGEEGAHMMPPLEFWYTAKVFDDLIGKQSGYDILVTTIGLPQDAGKSRVLKDKSRPKIAILNGTIYDLRAAFTPDMIVAAVTYNPKAVYDDKPVPKNVDDAFNKRYLLVTPENLQQVMQANQGIFRTN